MNGKVIEGNLKFSSDTYAHLYIYRNRPDVNGIVHTHSCYATAFAAVGRPIPVVLTAMCDEFGGPIPCGGYAKVGGDESRSDGGRRSQNGFSVLPIRYSGRNSC